MTDGHQLMIHFCANRFGANGTVNGKCKIQCRRTHRQHFYISLWRININFIGKKTGFKILKKVNTVRFLAAHYFSYLLKPFIKSVFFYFSFFIFPVSSQSFFSNLIHSFCSDLHFYPFTISTHYSSVQRLVSVGFGVAQPVTQPLRRRIVFISN